MQRQDLHCTRRISTRFKPVWHQPLAFEYDHWLQCSSCGWNTLNNCHHLTITRANLMDCLLIAIHKCPDVLVLIQCSPSLICIPNHCIRDAVLLSQLLVGIIEPMNIALVQGLCPTCFQFPCPLGCQILMLQSELRDPIAANLSSCNKLSLLLYCRFAQGNAPEATVFDLTSEHLFLWDS